MKTIGINEIFISIDGEVNEWGQGTLTTFIRLQGCNLKCSYCDTKQAQSKSGNINFMEIEKIVQKVQDLGCPKITITGGEPLLQENTTDLIHQLISKGFLVSVETNGTYLLPGACSNLGKLNYIVDYKLEYENRMIDLSELPARHWIKFVTEGEKSFRQALKVKRKLREKGCVARVAFSAIKDHKGLIERLIEEKEWDIVVNIQLHKLIDVK
jgi:7-carboxy-7-deazaguanine synthase